MPPIVTTESQVLCRRRTGPLSDVTILLVDDDELLRCSFVRLLQRRGAQVRSFACAEPGLESARADPPNLLVVDLELPDMTGFEVAEAMIADPRTADVPILAISGYGDDRTRAAALASGADAFLAKPCTTEELEEAVARLARHRSVEPAAAAKQPLDALIQAILRSARA